MKALRYTRSKWWRTTRTHPIYRRFLDVIKKQVEVDKDFNNAVSKLINDKIEQTEASTITEGDYTWKIQTRTPTEPIIEHTKNMT